MDPDDATTVPVRVVLFDVGGVLEIVEPMSPLLADVFGRVEDPDDLITTGHRSEEWMRRALVAQAGLPLDEVDSVMAAMWDWYCGTLDRRLYDWSASLPPRARVAILSNSADGARREEEARYGFSSVFDPIIYSHEVGLAKPDPRIFRLACDLLGATPEEVIFVDDVEANVEAARAIGMHGVHHRTTMQTIDEVEAILGPRVTA